jgi:hypothetical protein
MAGVRLSVTSLGVRKTLTPQQKAQAADTFGAEGAYMSAAKKLLDTSHPSYKRVTSVKNQAVQVWRGMSLPFPEPGLRLIRQDDIESFNDRMTDLKNELNEAVDQLNDHYAELVDAARQRLGSLFNAGDYPDSLIGLFDIAWDFPSVEPPDYLRRLNPQLYEQEAQRVAARFDQAVQLAEQAFMEELSSVVSHLSERLAGDDDGKPKVFRESAVTNLTDFFARFRQLNVRSNEQLDELVERAQQIVRGVQPQQLRDNQSLRQEIGTQLSGVQSVLDGLLVDRPRRSILRRPK